MRTTHYSWSKGSVAHLLVFIAQERRHTEIQPDGMENALQTTLITVTALHYPALSRRSPSSSSARRRSVFLDKDHTLSRGRLHKFVCLG